MGSLFIVLTRGVTTSRLVAIMETTELERERERSPALDRKNMRGEEESPGWNGLEESAKEKDLVRDWNGKEGKTMNAGGVEE
ncbi:hypothetical protein TNCV_4830961 [Trichonephila clavipes]|nr:hypothetical protein TNCV_4830961 [Trichonephila clavipes]